MQVVGIGKGFRMQCCCGPKSPRASHNRYWVVGSLCVGACEFEGCMCFDTWICTVAAESWAAGSSRQSRQRLDAQVATQSMTNQRLRAQDVWTLHVSVMKNV